MSNPTPPPSPWGKCLIPWCLSKHLRLMYAPYSMATIHSHFNSKRLRHTVLDSWFPVSKGSLALSPKNSYPQSVMLFMHVFIYSTCIRFIIIINYIMCSMLGRCWSLKAIIFVSQTSNCIFLFVHTRSSDHLNWWAREVQWLVRYGDPKHMPMGCATAWWPALISVLVRRNCVVSLSVKLVTRRRNLNHDRLV